MATTNGSLKIMVTGLHNDPVCVYTGHVTIQNVLIYLY